MNYSESLYGKQNYEPNWYALKTRYRHEKKVAGRLQQKGITIYLPLYTTYHTWCDRKKRVTEPLFSCYLFVKIPLKDRLPVLQTDGVINLVSFNNIPAPIPESQIDSIRCVLSKLTLVHKTDYYGVGEHVEVIQGPLKGIIGVLQKIKNQSRLVISIDVICQAISIDIDINSIKPID